MKPPNGSRSVWKLASPSQRRDHRCGPAGTRGQVSSASARSDDLRQVLGPVQRADVVPVAEPEDVGRVGEPGVLERGPEEVRAREPALVPAPEAAEAEPRAGAVGVVELGRPLIGGLPGAREARALATDAVVAGDARVGAAAEPAAVARSRGANWRSRHERWCRPSGSFGHGGHGRRRCRCRPERRARAGRRPCRWRLDRCALERAGHVEGQPRTPVGPPKPALEPVEARGCWCRRTARRLEREVAGVLRAAGPGLDRDDAGPGVAELGRGGAGGDRRLSNALVPTST